MRVVALASHGFRRPRRAALGAVVVALMATLLTPLSPVNAATAAPTVAQSMAADAANFNPAYIISDDLFYDGAALTASQIQYFLDSKIGTCTNGKCLNVATIAYPGRSRDVSASTGNLICEPIAAGTISAAELIYRAQTACGISAKVILVTLQKEQGLVTSKAPSDNTLRKAMGMACPDTAPCDSAFAGLGTQIVAGTRQLKVYKAGAFARQPGEHFIGYNPNSDCGGSYLSIRNYATAALYNYTPYQPNSAALANLNGTGDSCSSYGNRNFWRYYSDWFGSTIQLDPLRAIDDRYAELGGAAGTLGAAVGAAPACVPSSSTCTRTYEHGLIYWKRGAGTFVASGAIGQYVLANPTLAGFPLADGQNIVDSHGNGSAQRFERGWIHAGPTGTFWSPTVVMTAYSAAGWLRGNLGWPTSEVACGTGAQCIQWFAGGAVSGASSGPAFSIAPALAAAYSAAGGTTGELGFPLQGVQMVTDPNGNGFAWKFVNGWLHSGSLGTFVTSNSIMAEYSKRGWVRGSLGWPTADQSCNPSGCQQQFAGGAISVLTAADMTDAAIAQVWGDAGGAAGQLGLPMGPPKSVNDSAKGDGTAQQFERGWIHSSAAGTFATPAAVMAEYSKQGWLRGWLGWPVAACVGTPCSQEFAGGTIALSSTGVARSSPSVSNPQILSLYQSQGGASGPLGLPVQVAQSISDSNGNGFAQKFEKGWIHSGPSGAFATSNALMTAYSAQGWLRGRLGWPTGAEVCVASGCSQQFAGGLLYAPIGGASFVVADVTNASIKTLYDSLGGSAGTLGFAIQAVQSVTDAKGNGYAQRFQNGWIHSSAAGTFSTPTVLMNAYSAAGWVRGQLGWPTSAPSCGGSASMCVQSFSGGVLTAGASGSGVIPSAIATAYLANGGPTGSWGYPVLAPQTVQDPHGNGSALKLERGFVHSSPAGTFFSSNTVMAEYSARGWLRGSLGWPTTGEVCSAMGCAQTFAGGVIRYSYGQGASLVPAVSDTAIRTVWDASGGVTGTLGYPVAAAQAVTDPNGNGVAQQFERGWIHSSAAGTFATPSYLMTKYTALGWLRAPSGIGWPTGAVTCDAAACTQAFATTSIRVSVGELMTNSAIAGVWQGLGGAAGALGAPLKAPQSVTDPNGNGVAQQFERGWIHSGTLGTFWTPSAVMTEYSKQGWVRGSLGWPAANAECSAGGCVQVFANGSIDTR